MSKTEDSVEIIKDEIKRRGLIKVSVQKSDNGTDSIYRRVAKFLVLLGVDEAAKILPFLPPEQTEKIIPEIASIRSVDKDEAAAIINEFKGLLENSRQSGGVETARSMLEKAYGTDKAALMLEKAVPFAGTVPFEYMNELESDRVFLLLKDESAPVKALVLSHLEPKLAADTINQLEAAEKAEVIRRIAKMEKLDPESVKRVDQSLHEKMLSMNATRSDTIDGRGTLAQILKRMDSTTENGILDALSETDPSLSNELRERLFTIEDFIHAEDRHIQDVLREMELDELAVLIADKDENFRAKIFKNISKTRGAELLEEEDILKPIKKSDCRDVTNKFMARLRKDWECGDLIVLGRDDIYV